MDLFQQLLYSLFRLRNIFGVSSEVLKQEIKIKNILLLKNQAEIFAPNPILFEH